jgi:hypothetical protein
MKTNLKITPAKRVKMALNGEKTDKIPFTVYDHLIPQGETERALRNMGLCIVRQKTVFKAVTPNVTTKVLHYMDEGRHMIRTDFETPEGTLHTMDEQTDNDNQVRPWHHKRLFSSRDDYKAILSLIRDEQIVPDYDWIPAARKMLGEDFYLRGIVGYEPMQEIIFNIMGIENFCFEVMENMDEVLTLYHAINENRLKRLEICAESPIEYFNYGGNISVNIIGVERFVQYYMPRYAEAADILHSRGKILGCHFDGDCREIMKEIGETALDCIEAFSPSDSDLTMKEARLAWPDKIIWINFPSPVHLSSREEIGRTTERIIEEAGSEGRFLIGVTEDPPKDRAVENYMVIMEAIENNTPPVML